MISNDINPKIIQANFSRASASYDEVASIQKRAAKELVEALQQLMPSFSPKSILDLGTGTGYVTEYLLPIFPRSHYTLNDLSPAMLEVAKSKISRLNHPEQFSFVLGNMEDTNFDFHSLIISNFAMQWLNNMQAVLTKLYNHSDVLAFSCLLDGTFHEWSSIYSALGLKSPALAYPAQEELETFLLSLNPAKYNFFTKEYSVNFTSIKDFVKYLNKLGANASKHSLKFKDLKQLFINEANLQVSTITYKVFFAIVVQG